jgi:hypothetical protein
MDFRFIYLFIFWGGTSKSSNQHREQPLYSTRVTMVVVHPDRLSSLTRPGAITGRRLKFSAATPAATARFCGS